MKTLIFVLIQAGAQIVQAITGFGGGPLCMPPSIALVGIENARPAITFLFLFSCTIVAVQNFKLINKKVFAIMLAFMVVGMFAGLKIYSILPIKQLMIIFGIIVVLIGLVKFFRANTPPKELKAPWNYGALLLAGAMQGMFTSGGPFLVLYAAGVMKDKQEFRATNSAIWSVLNLYLCFNMYQNGDYTPYNFRLALFCLVPILGSIWVGSMISKKINKETFLKLVYLLLVAAGAILIMNAIL